MLEDASPTSDLPSIEPVRVVGIGASAGGLEAIERFFRQVPADSGLAYVVVQHLSPDFKSLMKELMERFTPLQVVPVLDREPLRRNTIYLLAPNRGIVIDTNELKAIERPSRRDNAVMPINQFFTSLASSWAERSIGLILSGTGTDGSIGIQDIYTAGGIVLVQSITSAGFDGMPRAAIATGCVDAVLDPESMPELIERFVADPLAVSDGNSDLAGTENRRLLELLLRRFGVDFGEYKVATIQRRIQRRVSLSADVDSIGAYLAQLEANPEELDDLYRDLLIGVTDFFRDPQAFEHLGESVVPEIVAGLAVDETARIWIAGCSTGEEAYSIAMLFLNEMDRCGHEGGVRVLATDLHRASLEFANRGVYPAERVALVPEHLRERFLIRLDYGEFKVSPDLRKTVIFSEHNLLTDPPFTRLDLASCRNLMIYLKSRAQQRAVRSMQFGLKLNGYLFLGASESPGDAVADFEPVFRESKIYKKIREGMRRDRGDLTASRVAPQNKLASTLGESGLSRVYDLLLNRFVPPGVLVNEDRRLIHIFGDAHRFLVHSPGRVTDDLISMLPDDLSTVIAAGLRNASREQTSLRINAVRIEEHDGVRHAIDVLIEPYTDRSSNERHCLVLFETQQPAQVPEVVPAHAVDELTANRISELEMDLTQARESLRVAVEELEASNEELQSSNEELLASNEELQSTNEELHSVNEELYSVNAEHEMRIKELNLTSSHLDNLVRSSQITTIFLDLELRIRLFTPGTEMFFGLMPGDVGRQLRDFRTRDDDSELFPDIEEVIRTHNPFERQVRSSDGHTYLRRIGVYRDTSGRFDGIVITFADIGEVIDDEGRTDVDLTNFVGLLPAAAAVFDWSKIGEVDDDVPAYGRASFDERHIKSIRVMGLSYRMGSMLGSDDRRLVKEWLVNPDGAFGAEVYARAFDAHASGESLFTHRVRVCAIGESKMIDAELNWAFVRRGERLIALLVAHEIY